MDNRIINNIKSLGIDMINQAGSGHPGIVLGASPIIYTLYANHLKINPNQPSWLNRDRFVLSAGHGSAMLYSTLYLAGYNITIEDLKAFRQIDSITPGHPEYGITPGVDMSTGPLGQGIASAVGLAIGEKILEANFTKELFNYHVYVLCGDGDLMEGISYEAASLAGNLKLDNLIVLYDSNNISLDGKTAMAFSENVCLRFEAMGWHTELVECKVESINNAIKRAKNSNKPSLIEVKTIIGKDSLNENSHVVHGKNLTFEDIRQLKEKLDIPNQPFYVDEEAKALFNNNINQRNDYDEWFKTYEENKDKIDSFINNKVYLKKEFTEDYFKATRVTSGELLNDLAKEINNLISGSADLSSSTKTYLTNMKDISALDFSGKNIWFGVREHAMGAILNGLALSNIRPFGSTFLVFADYLKPAIRLAALMNLPVSYIFTHDSVNVGEDGPTHQPIEQIAMLRRIPNLNVYRPADAKEVVGCYNSIINAKQPSALILGRNETKLVDGTDAALVLYGAYIVKKETDKLDAIVMATGSEVELAVNIANELTNYGIRVVSVPSVEIFDNQSKQYQKTILPDVPIIVIEASNDTEWYKYTKNIIHIDRFGYSGNKKDVLTKLNFNYEQIKKQVLSFLGENNE